MHDFFGNFCVGFIDTTSENTTFYFSLETRFSKFFLGIFLDKFDIDNYAALSNSPEGAR